MRAVTLLILFCGALLSAQTVSGYLSTGFYSGIPFWNKDNYQSEREIDPEDLFLRTVNRLSLKGRFGDHVEVYLSALRNDGFQQKNRLQETKIYNLYVKYAFSRGHVRVGRWMPFDRWLMGSLDGLELQWKIAPSWEWSLLAGQNVPYGKWYDQDQAQAVLQTAFSYRATHGLWRLKYQYNPDVQLVGAEWHGQWRALSTSARVSYNSTDQRLYRAGINLWYPWSKRLFTSFTYRLFHTLPWKLGGIEFKPYLVERMLVSVRYNITSSWSAEIDQLATLTAEHNDLITLITLRQRYFYAGVNFQSGDRDVMRMGATLGAQYTLGHWLGVNLGVAPVDYLYMDEDEHYRSTTFYFRTRLNLFRALSLRAFFNYYYNSDVVVTPYRGGVQLIYYLGS